MKRMLFVSMLFFALGGFSQEKAIDMLTKYGLTTKDVFNIIDMSSNSYSFTADCKTHSYSKENNLDKTETRVYKYEGSKNVGEKYTLISVDKKAPSKKKIKKFNKEKNSYVNDNKIHLRDEDFFIKSDKNDTLIIGFDLPKEELPAEIAFMAHSTGSVFINKKSKEVIRVEIKNKEPFNLKIFHVVELDTKIEIGYNEEHKQYFVSKENVHMQVLILGSITNIDIIEEYTDFKF
jgi:hypothetical protein